MFNQALGLKYSKFFKAMHRDMLFDWYMEIGCRRGRSFAPVRGKTIAVDPYFQVEGDIIGVKPVMHVFQATSDDFFASKFLALNKIKLSVSFIDGMHLFEFLLRDFMNTEASSDADGVIMLHDCIPYNSEMTTRDLDNLPKGAWTGDVWKLIPILKKYRPDLTVTVVDCNPSGLVMITNLSPKSTVLRSKYQAICKEYTDVTIEDFGIQKFGDSLNMVSAAAVAEAGFPMFKAVEIDPVTFVKPAWITP
ncbi:hypothetical protein [Cypionkella sp.]|uniref:hypothetical protein n=1 Tax=Cypionkella sp. TaxID=2811411 RepID=UPI0026264569|nr:hypothetical protein [Cypionkella sp.]